VRYFMGCDVKKIVRFVFGGWGGFIGGGGGGGGGGGV